MLTKQIVWASFLTLIFLAAPVSRADTIIQGSKAAGFQSWVAGDLKLNGKPYWDNKSLDGTSKKQKNQSNVGFFLTDGPIAPLDAPGELPYWGTTGKSKKKTGGNADLNFFLQRDELSSSAVLKLEVDSAANMDEFGWYDVADPSVLHPIFTGSESPVTTDTFTPSPQYGFYLRRGSYPTFYTQSSLNPVQDTQHQHFAIFQQSATPGAEAYWIGIENSTHLELKGKEGGLGDYNDMLIRVSALPPPPSVPEPSTAVLVLSSVLLMVRIRNRRR